MSIRSYKRDGEVRITSRHIKEKTLSIVLELVYLYERAIP
jgi:hypothetical protein